MYMKFAGQLLDRLPLPLWEGIGEGAINLFLITCKIPFKFSKTSLFQNLNTLNPSSLSQASLCLSLSFNKVCWPPSTSITILFSKFTKSTIYAPIGCCRRNLKPSNCLFLKFCHNKFSALVDFFLKFLAAVVIFLDIITPT